MGGARRWSWRDAWSWLGLNLGRRAGLVAAVGLLLTIVLGLGATLLRFQTSNASYLNANDPAQIDNHRYEHYFGGDLIVTMFTMDRGSTVNDLFTPANVAAFERVQAALHKDPSVFSVMTPLDAATLANRLLAEPPGSVDPTATVAFHLLFSALQREPSAKGKAVLSAYLASSLGQLDSVPPDARQLSNPAWAKVLLHNPNGTLRAASEAFFPNDRHAAMFIFLKGHQTITQESAAARTVSRIIDATHFQHARTLVTGVPELLRTINNYLTSGFITLGAIAALVMAVILLLLFTVRWRLLPFAIVAVGLVWAFGLTGYFHIPLTLGSIASLPVLLGVGMDYAIQLHSRVEEEVVLDRAAHPIQATARNLGPALLVVTFDCVFAFVALAFSQVPMVRQFGWLLVVGIVAVCVFSIFGTMAVLGVREYRSPTRGRDFSRGFLSRLAVRLGKVSPRAAVPLILISGVILVGGVAVEGHLKMETDPIQWIDPSAPTVRAMHEVRAGIGSDNYFQVLVTTDHPYSDQTVDFVDHLSRQLFARFPHELYLGSGMVNLVSELTDLPGVQPVPPTGAQVREVATLAPPDIRRTLVANGGRELGIVFEAKTATLEPLTPVVNDILYDVHPPKGIQVTPGGIALVGVGLIDNLQASRSLLTYLAVLFVGLFLAVRLRSVWRSLLSLVPVVIAVGIVALATWALGVQLSPMTAVSGPLVVAVCTEFTSLMLLRFVEERARGLDPAAAMASTASRTGRAFMVSGLTAVAGIAVIASSSWPLLRGFGVVVGLNVAIALVCALVVLPPILVWAERNCRNVVSRGLTAAVQETPRTIGRSPGSPGPSRPPVVDPDAEPAVPLSRILTGVRDD
jgi:hydrophobe/amphiphile efflux-3 (HAE3) family protein